MCLEILTKTRFYIGYFTKQQIRNSGQRYISTNNRDSAKVWVEETTLGIDNFSKNNHDSTKAKANKNQIFV